MVLSRATCEAFSDKTRRSNSQVGSGEWPNKINGTGLQATEAKPWPAPPKSKTTGIVPVQEPLEQDPPAGIENGVLPSTAVNKGQRKRNQLPPPPPAKEKELVLWPEREEEKQEKQQYGLPIKAMEKASSNGQGPPPTGEGKELVGLSETEEQKSENQQENRLYVETPGKASNTGTGPPPAGRGTGVASLPNREVEEKKKGAQQENEWLGKASGKASSKGKGPPPLAGKGKGPSGKGKGKTTVPEPKKPIITPQKEMKPLRWKRFQLGWNLEDGTIWDDVKELSTDQLPIDQLINLFSKTGPTQKLQTGAGAVVDNNHSVIRAKEFHIIEGTIQRCGRESALTKLPLATIVASAIREFNQEALLACLPPNMQVAELLRLLRDNVCPTPAQHDMLEQARDANPDLPLGNIERYMWEISRVPAYRERIECWLYLSTWEEDLKPVCTNLKHFGVIVESFRSSALPQLLGVVLEVGNYLNGGTKEGRADGFHLDLLKTGGIESVRDNQSKGDLRNFILSTYLTKYRQGATALLKDLRPALKNIRRVLENVEGGGLKLKKTVKISLERTIDEALSRIHAEFSKKHTMLQSVLGKGQDTSTSVRTIQEDFDQVQLKINDVQQLRDRAKDSYAKLLNWMHHNNQERSEEFFLLWDDLLIPRERFEIQAPSKVRSVLKPIFCEDAAEIDVYGLGKLWEVEVGGLQPRDRSSSATPRIRRPISVDDGHCNPRRTAALTSPLESENDGCGNGCSNNDTVLRKFPESVPSNPSNILKRTPWQKPEGDTCGSSTASTGAKWRVPTINFRKMLSGAEESRRLHPQTQLVPNTSPQPSPREPFFKLRAARASTPRRDKTQRNVPRNVQILGGA